jgi:hypothetical protein
VSDTTNGLPPGAVVLTEEMFDKTWHEWVRLPGLSARVSRMTTTQLLLRGFLRPPREWDPVEVERVKVLALAARPPIEEGAETEPVEENELLEARAQELRRDGVHVEIGMVGFAEVVSFQPVIPGSEAWPPEHRQQLAGQWFQAQPPEVQEAHLEALLQAQYRMVSAGLLTPQLRPDQVVRYKDDAFYLAARIADLSGVGFGAPAAEPAAPAPDPGRDAPDA